jgi:hypothetical protein
VAIDFPASPSVNDTKTVGDTVWSWNGTYWARSANTAKFTASDAAPSSPTLGDLWYESDSGKAFIYYDNTWVELGHASDGQSFKVGDTIPSSATAGDIWFESDTGKTFIYYTDANSSQWVELGHAAENLLLTASDAPPTSPDPGQFWFESDTGRTFIRYDGTWVEMGHAIADPNFSLVFNIDGGKSGTVYGGISALDGGASA